MPIEYPSTIPDLLTRFGLNPLDFTAYTDLLRELQELFDVAGTNPQSAAGTIGNRISAVEAELASPALAVITADATAITNTTTEVVFSNGFYAVPADSAVIGRSFRITAGGRLSTAGVTPGTITFRIRWGSANTDPLLVDLGPSAANLPVSLVNDGWFVHAVVTIRTIGGAGTAAGTGTAIVPASATDGTAAALYDQVSPPVTINTTAIKNLSLLVKWGTASASNTVTLDTFIVEQVN